MAVAKGDKKGYIYGRNTNPTVEILEKKVAILEGAESSTAFSSGMAAISNTLFANLKPGDRVVVGKDAYGGTSKIFMEFLPKFDIDVVFCDTTVVALDQVHHSFGGLGNNRTATVIVQFPIVETADLLIGLQVL